MAFPVQTLTQLRPILVGFRKSAGLTQAQLAARLGVTQQSYAQLEANPSAVSIERLFKVLNTLGVRLTLNPLAPDEPAEPNADTGSAARKPATKKHTPDSASAATAPKIRAKTTTGAARKRPAAATAGKPRTSEREDW
ncbi:helix-turn-helix domain-containing protein [Burkholderia stabilis]